MLHRKIKIKDFDDCGQKATYKNKQEAMRAAANHAHDSYGNVIKRPYRCKRCKNWHLTSLY